MNTRYRPRHGLLLPTLLLCFLWPAQATAETSRWGNWGELSTSLGFTNIKPELSSGGLEVFDATFNGNPVGDLTLEDETVTDRGSETEPSLILDWRLPFFDGNWSLQTIIAPEYTFSFEGTGPALGDGVDGALGETKMLPPVLTLNYHFQIRDWPVTPYLGAGGTYLYSYSSRITAEELGSPSLDIENVTTWVAQAGLNLNLGWLGLGERAYFNLDVKYIDPVRADADIGEIFIEDDGDEIEAEAASLRLKLEPIAFSAGLGWRF